MRVVYFQRMFRMMWNYEADIVHRLKMETEYVNNLMVE